MNLRLSLLYVVTVTVAALAAAQGPPAPPKPAPQPPGGGQPQQGVLEPPAGLPDVGETMRPMAYDEWAKRYFKVFTIPKANAILLGHNRVRPHRIINAVLEIVGESGDNYLVRNLPPEDPQSTAHYTWRRSEGAEVFAKMKQEYFQDKYLLVDENVIPPPFTDKVRFARRGDGLPTGGRWQMSFDVADMNGDGLPDLVFGPQRTGTPTPYIFLQQKDGSWKLWQEARWPTGGVRLDYGAVRVADFDGDGHPDIAIACHFLKTYVLYGDGKGDFRRVVQIPTVNPDMSARSMVVADVNGDGRPDIVTEAEVDINVVTTRRLTNGLVNVALNLPTGWKATSEGFPSGFMGDWLTAGDVRGTGKPDLLLTSRAQNATDLLFHATGAADKWEATSSLTMPVNSFVLANAIGPLDRFPQPDFVECFEQINPWKVEPPTQGCVVYRFHDAAGKRLDTPMRTPLFLEKVDSVDYQAVAIGDVDGDGRNDIVVASDTGKVRVFLQGADGSFYEQRNPGMDQPTTQIFDLKIVDLDHSGRGSIVFAGSPRGTAEGGGIWVYQAVKPGKVARKAP
ncbi:MAG TPA: VCBS repeat-containing protein [Thermoanaerobaculaceae bacterium]|nr:VCBS repeat-containing protein [Thermoanaerobaculaceae bacterium]